MEGRDGRALLRTMSFLSSRARALRQRFGTSQPSLSDSWVPPCDVDSDGGADTDGEAAAVAADAHAFHLTEDPRLASPDMGGSLLSLLDEPGPGAWPGASARDADGRGGAFRAQRSKSLDSLSAGQSGLASPPVAGQLPLSPLMVRPPPSPPPHVHIPRPHAAVSPVSLGRFPDSSIPRIPGPPPSPMKFSTISAPTTPRHVDSYSPLTPRFPESFVPRINGPPLSPKMSRPSTPKLSEEQSPVSIPKIPAPPVSPKHSRPSTPKNLESVFPDLPKLHAPIQSPKVSRPSTPKHLEPIMAEAVIIPRIPGPPPSPKHSRPSTPKNMEKVETLIDLDIPASKGAIPKSGGEAEARDGREGATSPRPAARHPPLQRCLTLPARGEADGLPPEGALLPLAVPGLGLGACPKAPKPPKSPAAAKPSAPLLEQSESGSFDSEENRDTVAEGGLTRPNLFDLRPRPKLKQQWSMDETRAAAQRDLAAAAAIKPAEKRRRFFMRKQTNSAPDSFDGVIGHIPPPKPKEHHSVSFCLGNVRKCRGSDSSIQPPALPTIKLEPELGVEHLADLRYPDGDPPCHFCCQQTSTSIHDENRLKIVSGGLVRSRDGSRDDSGTHYMNLPSPNVQNEDSVFHRRPREEAEEAAACASAARRSRDLGAGAAGGGACSKSGDGDGDGDGDGEGDSEEQAPPASALTRRRALVPPKLLAEAGDERKLSSTSDGSSARARRSSIVVIPPMQICPGDLLVYSKVLTHRNNLLDVDGSTTSLAVSDTDGVNSRKGKNTWSLLRLFERSSRGKSGSLCGLEEVLSCMPRVDFDDEQLSRYRGMCWTEFVAHVEQHGQGGPRHEKGSSGSGSSGSSSPSSPDAVPPPRDPSPPPPPPPPQPKEPSPSPPRRRLRGNLVRAQSERCFERRLAGARSVWRGLDRTLPLRPSPLVSTLSEKDLLVSPVSTTSRIESKRREAVWDLFQSECAFLYDHLMVMKNVFMEPLKKIQVEGFAMFAEPELLFGNLDELCCVTYAFCKEFINLLLANVGPGGEFSTIDVLVKLFQKSTEADSVSQAYHCYALNYINALNYLEALRRHIEFCEFEKWCSRDPRCKKLQLTDLLVAPVQHIMKVPLILKEVESRTEDSAERELIQQILETEENSIRELDDKMKWLKNFERLLEIQRNIVWPSVFELDPKIYVPEFLKPALTRQPCDRIIVSPRRQIIIEGSLQLWDSGKPQEMFVVLFDDMLLITRRKKGLSKKKSSLSENWASSCSRGSSSNESSMRYIVYKQPLSLDRFFIHDITVPESASCRLEAAFVLVSLNRFQQVVTIHTFQAPTDQVKQTWLLKLRDTQDKWKRTLQNTVFRSPRLSTCSAKSST